MNSVDCLSVTACLGLSSLSTDQMDNISPFRGSSDKEVWRSCIHDIQDSIMARLADKTKVIKMIN